MYWQTTFVGKIYSYYVNKSDHVTHLKIFSDAGVKYFFRYSKTRDGYNDIAFWQIVIYPQ